MDIKQLSKIILLVLAVLASGLVGGLAAFYYFVDLSSLDGNAQGPVLVAQKQEIIVRENEAIVDAIAKISGIAVYVEVTGAKGTKTSGSGVIITSDGLAAVPYSLYPPGTQADISVGGQKTVYTVLKRDKAANIAIIKLDGSNRPTSGFASAKDIKLGQRVFMVGMLSPDANFANEGIVRSIGADLIGTTIKETAVAAGSPVLDIEGKIIGIATVNKDGFIDIIPVAKIKEIANL